MPSYSLLHFPIPVTSSSSTAPTVSFWSPPWLPNFVFPLLVPSLLPFSAVLAPSPFGNEVSNCWGSSFASSFARPPSACLRAAGRAAAHCPPPAASRAWRSRLRRGPQPAFFRDAPRLTYRAWPGPPVAAGHGPGPGPGSISVYLVVWVLYLIEGIHCAAFRTLLA